MIQPDLLRSQAQHPPWERPCSQRSSPEKELRFVRYLSEGYSNLR